MTKHEAAIISAYTKVLIGEFSDMHAYIEKAMGRAVFTHEMGGKEFWEGLKDATHADFLKIHEGLV